MGRTKLYEKIISTPMSTEMIEGLERVALDLHRPVSEVIRSMVRAGLVASAAAEPIRMPWEREVGE